jgi:hypothetical protein
MCSHQCVRSAAFTAPKELKNTEISRSPNQTGRKLLLIQ